MNNLQQAAEWSTGIAEYDEYVRSREPSSDVLHELAGLQPSERAKIIQSTMKCHPGQIDAWLNACIRRAKQSSTSRSVPYPAQPPRMPQNTHSPANAGFSLPSIIPASTPSALSPVPSPVMPSPTMPSPMTPVHSPAPAPNSQGETRRALFASPANDSMTAPLWITKAFAELQDRSQCVAVIFENLDAMRVERLAQLPPYLQMNIAISMLWNPGAWSNPNEYIQRALDALQRLESPSSTTTVGTSKMTIKLVVLTVGLNLGTGHLALHAALQQMKRHHPDVIIQRVATYSFETDEDALKLEKKVAEVQGSLHQCGDAEHLRAFVQANAQSWQDCKFLVLATLPSEGLVDTKGTGKGPGTALHQKGGRLAWEIHKTIGELQTLAGPSSCLSLVSSRPAKHHQDENTLNSILGASFTTRPTHYQGPASQKHVRTNPQLQQNDLKVHWKPIDPKQSIDGWVWQGNAVGAEMPTTGDNLQYDLHDDIVNAAGTRLFDPSLLSNYQKDALQSWVMQHMSTKEERMLSRKMWLHIFGVMNSPFLAAADSVFPCHGTMVQLSGTPAAAGSPTGKPCGDLRYCQQCAKVLKLLSRGWHVALKGDIIVGLLKKGIARWTDDKQSEGWWQAGHSEAHDCSSSCPLQHNAVS